MKIAKEILIRVILFIITISITNKLGAQNTHPIKDCLPLLSELQSSVGLYVHGKKVIEGKLSVLQVYVLNEMEELDVNVTLMLNGRLFYEGNIDNLNQFRFHKLRSHSSIISIKKDGRTKFKGKYHSIKDECIPKGEYQIYLDRKLVIKKYKVL